MTQKKSPYTNGSLVTRVTEKSDATLKPRIPNVETAAILAMAEHDEDVEHFDNTADLYASWD